MALSELEVDELQEVYDRYDENFFQYNRYLNELDYDTRRDWEPIIKGVMLGNNIADFMPRMDWDKEEVDEIRLADGTLLDTIVTKGKVITPPCGDIPNKVLCVCYHAKRLSPEIIDHEVNGDRKKAQEEFESARRRMLYGRDALSVIEYFEEFL